MKCVQETTQCAREGRFEKLINIRDQHVAALQEQFTEGNPEPQHSNENQFIADYTEKLTEINIRDQHVAALQEQFTEGNPEPQHSNENQFIADYTEKLTEIHAR